MPAPIRGGGAGIQADLKAFAAMGLYGTSVITAVTAQNSTGVTDIHPVPVSTVRAQIRAVLDDFQIAAFKTGLLPSAEVAATVAGELVRVSERPLVVDPVFAATTTGRFVDEGVVEEIRKSLIPLATVLTPNIEEASLLSGIEIETGDEAREAAIRLKSLGCRWVLIKGGHLEGEEAVDLLFDGREALEFRAPRLDRNKTHGTGCVFASAIAARLARGESVPRAVRNAKVFITEAIRRGIEVGHGSGPVNPLYFLPDWSASIDPV